MAVNRAVWGWEPTFAPLRRYHFSLPLMGIGNPHPSNRYETGSLPLRAGLDAPTQNIDSLPLMGIGNLAAPHRLNATHLPATLITPHGDRERSAAAFGHPPPGDQSHYPSWGSGTVGIYLHLRPCFLNLITPHGDREPRERLRRSGAIRPHYPSWGSGTAPSASESARRSRSHYPSWGSGTY